MDVKIRRSLGILTVLVFLLANVVIVSAEVPDIKSHWAEEVVTSWIGQGLISGYEDGSFKPNDPVKRAEFVAFSNRVLKLLDKSESAFNDVSANAWYSEDVLKAVEADMIKGYGDGIFKPEAPITRQEAAVVLFNAFELAVDESNSANSFADSGKIASWAKSAVSSLYKEGYVKGRTGNNFAPTDNITRAETVAMINNIMGTLIKSGGEFTNSVKGNLVVNTANVVLKGMEIEGDLYLTQGIGEGEIVLDNVIVKGRTVVKGGGSDSIVFKNTKLGKDLLVNKKGANKVRIVAQGGTEIPKVSLKSPAKLLESELTGKGFEIVNIAVVKNVKATGNVELDGDFTDVSVDTEDSKVDVIKGTISNINIQAKAEVSISGGTINAIKVAPQAAAAIVSIAKVAIVKLLDVAAKADIRIAGKLESITVQKEAADATINVDEGAQVLAITIEAKITITGKGVITTATINVSGVVIETKPANVTLGQNVTSTIGEETVTGDTSSSTGGGGGGGGDDGGTTTTKTITPKTVSFAVYGEEIPDGEIVNATVSVSTATIDLEDYADSDEIYTVNITATPSGCTLYVESIEWGEDSESSVSRTVYDIDEIAISDLLGTDNPEIGIGTMRALFGETVTVNGRLSKSGYQTKNVKLVMNLGELQGEALYDWVDIEKDGTTIIATIKSGQESKKLVSIGIATFLMTAVGKLPSEVKIGENEYIDVANENYEFIKECIYYEAYPEGFFWTEEGNAWGNVEMSDLVGMDLKFKLDDDSTEYTLVVQE